MIAMLRGRLVSKRKDSVIIETNGVGFRVVVPQRLIAAWDTLGVEIQVYTHLQVRENELALYGCDTEEELAFFNLLLGVSGVGPKAAMSILSELSFDALRQAIGSDDASVLSRVSGIGPKTAKKIIFHLKDRFPEEELRGIVSKETREWESEVIAALMALGYNASEARSAVSSLPSDITVFEERLRLALRYFAK